MQKNWWIWLTLPAAATTALLAGVAVISDEGEDDASIPTIATSAIRTAPAARRVTTTIGARQTPLDRAANTTTSAGTPPPTRATTTTQAQRTEIAQVPDVYGLTAGAAVAELEQSGFRARIRREQSFQPDGLVFAQTPRSGRRFRQGKTVLVTVSVFKSRAPVRQRPTAPPVSALPRVAGLSYWEAAARLELLGVVANLNPIRSNRPLGVVVTQAPAAGVRVSRGSRVWLTVSRGQAALPAYTVPDTVGLRELTAHARCRDVNFTCRTVLAPAEGREAGRVVRQRPRAGSIARALTQMTLYVGR